MNKQLKSIVNKRLAKILFVPDTHAPMHCKKSWKLMMTAMKDWKPDVICVLGDFVDFSTISFHEQPIYKKFTLKQELNCANQLLDQLDSLKPASAIYIGGNHDAARMDRFLAQESLRDKIIPFLESGALIFNPLPNLLHLDKRGWEFVQYKDYYKLGKLYVTHDVGKAGQNANIDASNTFQSNAVIGHTHRMSYAVTGTARGETHVGAMFGWLGSAEAAAYAFRGRVEKDWVNGFGVGYLDKDESVYLVPVPIFKNRCMVEGKIYKL